MIQQWILNPNLDRIAITYSLIGDTVTIFDIEYDNDGFVILEMLGVNLVGSLENLQSGDIFYAEITKFNDTIEGNDYPDLIFGGPGDDDIFGWSGNDFLSGDAGADFLYGMAGNDGLFGGSGEDLLEGDSGKDQLYGGSEYDSFLFDAGYDKDIIKDFERKVDDIWIDKSLARNLKQVKAIAEGSKKGVTLDFGGGDKLLIEGLKLNKLKKVDFWFTDLDI